MKLQTEFADGFVTARSYLEADPGSLLGRHYDIAFLSPSWDLRSSSITQATDLRVGSTFLVKMSDSDPDGIPELLTYPLKLASFLGLRCRRCGPKTVRFFPCANA